MPAGMTTIIVNDADKNYDENVDTTDFAMNLIYFFTMETEDCC